MAHPTPQTPDELTRECMGTIARVAEDIHRAAMEQDAAGVQIHYDFLKIQMARLETIRKYIRRV